jgi:HTH-type transcriptional regulator/antitoxin HigA
MIESPNLEYTPRSVPHPGEMVVEYLESFGWSQRDLARRADVTPKTISEICSGKASISPATALAFEKTFARPAHFWLALQRRFDEFEARKLAAKTSSKWTDWADRFPLKELADVRLINPSNKSSEERMNLLLSFLGVSSPGGWQAVWEANNVSYRQTRSINASVEAISAWVRATEVIAAQMRTREFDESRLYGSLSELRSLTLLGADKIQRPVQELCGAAGVAVVWLPAFKKTGISGCARWLSDSKALIGISLRFKTDDEMWFTLFHELAHILLHKKRRGFILDNAETDLSDQVIDPEMRREEDEANRFASDTLIPPERLAAFIKAGVFDSDSIVQFAEYIGIAPGVVVGRLQRERVLARHQGNDFKQKLSFNANPR